MHVPFGCIFEDSSRANRVGVDMTCAGKACCQGFLRQEYVKVWSPSYRIFVGFIFLTPGIYVLLYLSGVSHSGLDHASTNTFSHELNLQSI